MMANEFTTPSECFGALLLCSPRTLDELRAHLRASMHADCIAVLDGDPSAKPNESCDRCNALHALEQLACHAQVALEN